MVEQIQCVMCGEYEEAQIGTEQFQSRLCFDCEEERSIREANI